MNISKMQGAGGGAPEDVSVTAGFGREENFGGQS
jgi:hypothetical protein